jgi:hypothetical protein
MEQYDFPQRSFADYMVCFLVHNANDPYVMGPKHTSCLSPCPKGLSVYKAKNVLFVLLITWYLSIKKIGTFCNVTCKL